MEKVIAVAVLAVLITGAAIYHGRAHERRVRSCEVDQRLPHDACEALNAEQ